MKYIDSQPSPLVKRTSSSGFTAIEIVAVIAVVVGLAGLSMLMFGRVHHNRTTAQVSSLSARRTADATASEQNANTDYDNDLASISASMNQETSDQTNANANLNDQSKQVAIPTD